MGRTRRSWIVLVVIGFAAAGCREEPELLRPNLVAEFGECARTTEMSRAIFRHLADDGFDTLDRAAASRQTGHEPARPIDILAVNARDDVVEVQGGSSAQSGFRLLVQGRHRPGFRADVDGQDRLLAFVAREFGCTLAKSVQADNRPDAASQHQALVRDHRSEISRYR